MIINVSPRKFNIPDKEVHPLDKIVASDAAHQEKVAEAKDYWRKEGAHSFTDNYTVESLDAIILRNDKYATKLPITEKGRADLEQDISFKNILIRAGAGKLTALENAEQEIAAQQRYLTMLSFPENFRQLLDDARGARFAEAAIYYLFGLNAEYERIIEDAGKDGIMINKLDTGNANLLNTLFEIGEHPRTDDAAKDCAKQIIAYCHSNLGSVPETYYWDKEVEDARTNFEYIKKKLEEVYLSGSAPKEKVIACAWDTNLENLLRKENRIAVVDQKGKPENIYFNPVLCAGMLVNNLEVAIASKDHIGTTQFKENASKIVQNLNKIFLEEPENHSVYVPKKGMQKLTDLFSKESIHIAFMAGYTIAQTRYVRFTYSKK